MTVEETFRVFEGSAEPVPRGVATNERNLREDEGDGVGMGTTSSPHKSSSIIMRSFRSFSFFSAFSAFEDLSMLSWTDLAYCCIPGEMETVNTSLRDGTCESSRNTLGARCMICMGFPRVIFAGRSSSYDVSIGVGVEKGKQRTWKC